MVDQSDVNGQQVARPDCRGGGRRSIEAQAPGLRLETEDLGVAIDLADFRLDLPANDEERVGGRRVGCFRLRERPVDGLLK